MTTSSPRLITDLLVSDARAAAIGRVPRPKRAGPGLADDRRGAAAVEFAFVAPILVALLFGIVGFGAVISVDNGLQQLVAEAARASVAGLSDAERAQLAQASVASSVGAYPFINAGKLTLTTADPSSTSFQVTARYDMSGLFAYRLLAFLPLPSPTVTRSAVVQRGGF